MNVNREPRTLVRDPVCGMEIDPDKAAATVERDGETVYFCSLGCKERFAPGRAAEPPTAPAGATSGPARCTPRSSATRPATARSAAWRWSRGRSGRQEEDTPSSPT